MAEASDKPLIYVSYSHKDAKWFSYVMPYLETAARAVDAEIWADRELSGGDDWRTITDSKLRACRIFVLLVSSHSITSESIAKELAAVLQRERYGEPVVIFPIVVSPTAEISSHPVSEKVLRPANGKALSTFAPGQRNRQMDEIAEEIAAIITKHLPSLESQGPEPAPEPDRQPQPAVLVAIIARDKLLATDGVEFRQHQVISWPTSRLLPGHTTPALLFLKPGDIILGILGPPALEASHIWERDNEGSHSGIVGMVGVTSSRTAQTVPVIVTETISGRELGALIDSHLEHWLRANLRDDAVTLPKRELDQINAWLTSHKRRAVPYPPEEVSRLLRAAGIPDQTESERPVADPRTSGQKVDAYVPFRNDAPSETDDALDRGPLALFLGRRLHLIWCEMNGYAPRPKSQPAPSTPKSKRKQRKEASEGDTFIVHIDAPWGGGKTTFANFVARVLDPRDGRLSQNHFLRFIASPLATPTELKAIELSEIFYADPDAPVAERERWDPEARLPWIVARYDAWRDQYVYPPWWHVFLTIQQAICDDLLNKKGRKLSPFLSKNWWGEVISPRWSAFCIRSEKFVYQMWNAKIRSQLTLLGLGAVIFLVVWRTGVITSILQKSGAIDPKRGKEWIDIIVAVLGFAGVSIATLFAVISQSLVPDLDFTAEHKQIGVSDPIGRFRSSFRRILRHAGRPVLLIVDDIDRCEPKAVVEILRGFQTIVRSPRLFVIVLGDRSWIEKAHEIYHKDFAGILVGTETGLGARFVEKMFQLSFTLPAMKAEVRNRFTRTVLGGAPDARTQAEAPGNVAALGELHVKLKTIDSQATVPRREELVGQLKAAAIKGGLPKEEADSLANLKLVATAGSDADYQGEMFNILSQLAATLPNNPRQIKRIVNAFAIYETVGRLYFNYQCTADGTEEGSRRAYRWRQLAMWVTLATEWPDLWRTLARTPGLIDVALAKPPGKNRLQKKLLAEQSSDAERALLNAVLHRLTYDYSLTRLLCVNHNPGSNQPDPTDSGTAAFPETRLEAAAIYDFNRIMWEPGFPTQNPAPAPAV
jgi:hypothetical protein